MSQTPLKISSNPPNAKEDVLVHGNLWKAIWVMSWPLLLTTVCSSVVGLVDMQMAGRLGSAQQAAVGVTEQCIFIFMVFVLSAGVGTTAIVSRAYGANKMDEAIEASSQSIVFGFFIGVSLTLVSGLLAQFGIPLFTQSPEVVAHGREYLGIYSLFVIPWSLIATINAAFRAIGAAKMPLFVTVATAAVTVVGDYLTIVCNWPVPGLGLRGIAYSGVISSFCGATISVYLLYRSELKECLKKLFPVDFEMLKRIIKIGIPSAFQRMGWSLSVFAIFFILRSCEHHTQAIAAWTIGMRVEALVFMPLMALSLAVSSIVGQNLGAKQPDRAFKAGWNVAWIGVWMMVVAATGLYLLAGTLARSMSSDPITIDYVTYYLQTNALCEPFLAIGMILSGALQGAGDTKAPMWISLGSSWLFRLPIAYYLVSIRHWGPRGAWVGMASSIVVLAAMNAFRYQSKTWLKTKV